MTLLGEPAPDFSDPLGMLGACHRRMLALCDLLDRLPDWIDEHGVDVEALAGIERVERYFTVAAPLHHADEEHDLFPLLVSHPDLADLVSRLRQDHHDLDRHWSALTAALQATREQRSADSRLRDAVARFSPAYRAHIERENNDLLPHAAERLSTEQLARLGEHMAARRG